MLNEEKSASGQRLASGGKTKLAVSLMLVLLTAAFIFIHPVSENAAPVQPPPPTVHPFFIGGLHDAADVNFTYLNSLNFNLWHSYVFSNTWGGKTYPTGWLGNNAPADTLFAVRNDYVGQVQNVIDDINDNNMKALLHRPKIEYLCYGQRSDYQCEGSNIDNPDVFFYTFNNHSTGISTTDSGKGVVHCRTIPSNSVGDNPGFVVKRLKANTEQCHRETGSEAYRWDSQSEWLIKPRIRIDSTIAHNSGNTNVCRIIVLNQNLDTIKNLIIKANNFINPQNGQYNGQYLEEFFFGTNDSNLTIRNHWGDWWTYSARGTRDISQETDTSYKYNRADIQVYWYGNCDMWIDYVRVDNDVAHNLFSTDPFNLTHETYEDWLEWEAQDIACYNPTATINFYIELVEFNNLPCIKKVNERLNAYKTCSNTLNVAVDLLCFYQYHLTWGDRGIIDTPEMIKTLYMDYTGAQEIFLGDPYPLIARRPTCTNNGVLVNSQIPSTLPTTSGANILANIVSSPANYDAWLQGQLDTICTYYKGGDWINENHLAGVYLYLMKNGHEVSKLTDKPFYAMLQAHQWIGGGEVDREPTVEEQDMMTNLAVSYGARGIIYWGGASFITDTCRYNYAYWESNVTPRYNNVYGQPKWDSLMETTKRLKTWGPALMSFDNANRKSYIYRLERTYCLGETYFSDIVTYKPGTGQPPCYETDAPDSSYNASRPTGLWYECNEDRYLQVSTFKKSTDDGNKYFMIVNRRCSPYVDESTVDKRGGKRFIRVHFDQNHNDFAGYNNWNIIDIENERAIVGTFDKTSPNPFVDLGWFDPGKGRLYKMVPTVIKGGILKGDEDISGQTFTPRI